MAQTAFAAILRTRRQLSLLGENSFKTLGSAYEKHVQAVLYSWRISTEICGAKGDGGVDLRGHWILSNDCTPSVLVQCKRTEKPCPPNFVRELEGAWQIHTSRQGIMMAVVAMLVCTTEPTPQTLSTIRTSSVPMAYVQLPADTYNVMHVILNVKLQQIIPLLAVGQRTAGRMKVTLAYNGESLLSL